MYSIHHSRQYVINQNAHEERETIHSGQFMVSDFEAEAQDDEDEDQIALKKKNCQQQLEIDTSLAKLFQYMSLTYRQKLTSPKWNRFRGIRLPWKDKIRLNNVIWRCWHLQFIRKVNTLICQFASPLETDTHNKPEAVVLEGKYWKRKLSACTAEYKKWRAYYRNHFSGHSPRDHSESFTDADLFLLESQSNDSSMNMVVDEDYERYLMSDTLFSTIINHQPFPFPDSREIAKAGLADFIQPSLGPLQPNLEDYMDTFEQNFMQYKLPTVPEEQPSETDFKGNMWNYPELTSLTVSSNLPNEVVQNSQQLLNAFQPVQENPSLPQNTMIQPSMQLSQSQTCGLEQSYGFQNQLTLQQEQKPMQAMGQYMPSMQNQLNSTPLSKGKQLKNITNRGKFTSDHMRSMIFNKSMDNIYECGASQDMQMNGTYMNIRMPEPPMNQNQVQQQQMLRMVGHSASLDYKLQATSFSQSQDFNKFAAPGLPEYNVTSQDDKPRFKNTRGRPRSRSNTREPIKRPPLTSAGSDPSLVPPTPSKESTLLTRLLTGSPDPSTLLNRSQNTTVSDSSMISVKSEDNSPISLISPSAGSNPANALIITPVNIGSVAETSPDPLLLTPLGSSSPLIDSSNSSNVDLSSQNIDSPTSSHSSIGSPNRDGRTDHRRAGHIHAEQKRRFNIKNGFDMLHSLIPHLNQNPNAKLSKAAMLQKGAEYIRQLQMEREQLKEEIDMLRQQINSLNSSISNCQSLLPATGAPVARGRSSKMEEMFNDYVRRRTVENWKFWIFSLIFRPLLDKFNNSVSTTNIEDLYRTTMLWIEQHCTLGVLRPVGLDACRHLSISTNVLLKPDKLPEEARREVTNLQEKK